MTAAITLLHPRPDPVTWSPDLFVDMSSLDREWRLAFAIECPRCHAPPGVACSVCKKNGEFHMAYKPHEHRLKKGRLNDPAAVARRAYLAQVKAAVKDQSSAPNVFESEKPPKWPSEHVVDKGGRYAGRYGFWGEL